MGYSPETCWGNILKTPGILARDFFINKSQYSIFRVCTAVCIDIVYSILTWVLTDILYPVCTGVSTHIVYSVCTGVLTGISVGIQAHDQVRPIPHFDTC